MRKTLDRYLSRLTPFGVCCLIGSAVALCVVSVAVLVSIFPPARLGEFPPLEPRLTSQQRLIIDSPDHLERAFDRARYDLSAIRAGQADVPDLLLKDWPHGFETMTRAKRKKTLFIRTLLPLILYVNRTIAAQRDTLHNIIRRREKGFVLSRREKAWLNRLARLYRTKPDDLATLLRRVAPVPPSLAIAQAATETGWGTSRFAREANALFGQWTYNSRAGIKPKDADPGTRHAIKRYDRLLGSAWDYARNLNTHQAYFKLRESRAKGVTEGPALAETLEKYSETRGTYVMLLRNVIAHNGLAPLDKAKLRD